MSILSKHIYRVPVDHQEPVKYWTDYETGEPFSFPSGVSMQIQIGIRENKKSDLFYDVPAGTVFKLEIKNPRKNGDPPDADDPAYMAQSVSVASLTSLSAEDWQAGTGQHATFDYTAADTALPPGTYWMVISGVLPDGSLISSNFAKMEVIEDGTGLQTTVAPTPPSLYNAAAIDALLALKQDSIPSALFSNSIFLSPSGTDDRAGLSPYSGLYPFASFQAAHDAASEGDTIFAMPGDYSGGGSVEIEKDLNVQTYWGTLLPRFALATGGKVVNVGGNGAIAGISSNSNSILNCSGLDVLGPVELAGFSGGSLAFKNCYIEFNATQVISVLGFGAGVEFKLINSRVKATGVDADCLKILFTMANILLENSTLEANGNGNSVTGDAGVVVNVANVFANKPVSANITQQISAITVDSNVAA